jgi:hypothetical protein
VLTEIPVTLHATSNIKGKRVALLESYAALYGDVGWDKNLSAIFRQSAGNQAYGQGIKGFLIESGDK